MGLSLQATGILSLCVRKTKWLLMNLRMLQMLKVTCGCWMVKYWSSWLHLVCNPGTILWTVTPACLTWSWMDVLSKRRKEWWRNNVWNIQHSEKQKNIKYNSFKLSESRGVCSHSYHQHLCHNWQLYTFKYAVNVKISNNSFNETISYPHSQLTSSSKTMWKGKALQNVFRSMHRLSGYTGSNPFGILPEVERKIKWNPSTNTQTF